MSPVRMGFVSLPLSGEVSTGSMSCASASSGELQREMKDGSSSEPVAPGES